jgi:hypothetical protein
MDEGVRATQKAKTESWVKGFEKLTFLFFNFLTLAISTASSFVPV